jgi:hypothetical protein
MIIAVISYDRRVHQKRYGKDPSESIEKTLASKDFLTVTETYTSGNRVKAKVNLETIDDLRDALGDEYLASPPQKYTLL